MGQCHVGKTWKRSTALDTSSYTKTSRRGPAKFVQHPHPQLPHSQLQQSQLPHSQLQPLQSLQSPQIQPQIQPRIPWSGATSCVVRLHNQQMNAKMKKRAKPCVNNYKKMADSSRVPMDLSASVE